jgi:hypothetical protein
MLFSKKPKSIKVNYRVYFTKLDMYQQLLAQLKQENTQPHLIYFFDQTKEEMRQLLQAASLNIPLDSAYDVMHKDSDRIILIDLHPLASVMQKFLQNQRFQQEVTCFMGMDDILMRLFGADRIALIMEKMGMKSDEEISHSMINSSIENAQKKMDERLPHFKDIRTSAEEWARENGII